MNLRDREFPDRRGARREVAPRSSRSVPALAPVAGPSLCDSELPSVPTVTAPSPSPMPMQILRGQAVSSGIAIGPVIVLDPRGLRLPPRSIASETIFAELARLDRGLEAAQAAAGQDEREARARLGPQYADILAAHRRMICDPTLRGDAQDHRRATFLRGTCCCRCSRGTRIPVGATVGFSSGGSGHRCPRHRSAHPLALDRRAAPVVSGRSGRAGDIAGPRFESQRCGRNRSSAGPGLRD